MKRIKNNQTLNEAIQSDIDAILHEMRHSLHSMSYADGTIHESVIHIDVDAVLRDVPPEAKSKMTQMQKIHENTIAHSESREFRFHGNGDFLMNSSSPRNTVNGLIRLIIDPLFLLLKRFEY